MTAAESIASRTPVERKILRIAFYCHRSDLRLEYTGYGHQIGICLLKVTPAGMRTLVCAAAGVSRETAAQLLLRRVTDDAKSYAESLLEECADADALTHALSV